MLFSKTWLKVFKLLLTSFIPMTRSRIILENDVLKWSKVIPDRRKQFLLQNANIHLSIYCSLHKVKPTNTLFRNTSPNHLGYGMLDCMLAFWRRNCFLLSGITLLQFKTSKLTRRFRNEKMSMGSVVGFDQETAPIWTRSKIVGIEWV